MSLQYKFFVFRLIWDEATNYWSYRIISYLLICLVLCITNPNMIVTVPTGVQAANSNTCIACLGNILWSPMLPNIFVLIRRYHALRKWVFVVSYFRGWRQHTSSYDRFHIGNAIRHLIVTQNSLQTCDREHTNHRYTTSRTLVWLARQM